MKEAFNFTVNIYTYEIIVPLLIELAYPPFDLWQVNGAKPFFSFGIGHIIYTFIVNLMRERGRSVVIRTLLPYGKLMVHGILSVTTSPCISGHRRRFLF